MKIKGDPLTGSLPATRAVVTELMGPNKRPKPTWPHIADPMAITVTQMEPGRVAYVRTRFGIRRWKIRTINRSYQGRNKGRHYFVGETGDGWCRSAWIDAVVSVQSVQRALTAGKALKQIGPGR